MERKTDTSPPGKRVMARGATQDYNLFGYQDFTHFYAKEAFV
jgi:hypothetical protein